MIGNHIGELSRISPLYLTDPWGNKEQQAFINQACQCKTTLKPLEILAAIHIIENKMGRVKKEHWGPRIIDIDILFYGDKIINEVALKIPHPQLTNRMFVMQPLADICPDWIHPSLGKKVKLLKQECKDNSQVQRLNKHEDNNFSI